MERLYFHLSLNYFCCHTLDEQWRIISTFNKLPKPKLCVKFDKVECFQVRENTLGITLSVDDNSEQLAQRYVAEIEGALQKENLVVMPRKLQYPFHITLAGIHSQDDGQVQQETERAVARLNALLSSSDIPQHEFCLDQFEWNVR
eukprot:TRINITY_DN90785_c0_g1_i1.p1 TRINITY_DN90785_c0_g1~~TRINITY_DN90785_c0_g1_i1.p1  ORF type:complete len:145 (-),score=11.87 TRINITY_DN90785_c0_g1_i1:8-442(-)